MQYMNDKGFFDSYDLIQIEDWLVKISKMNAQVQVFMYNPSLGQTAIQWFETNESAEDWIEFMIARYTY